MNIIFLNKNMYRFSDSSTIRIDATKDLNYYILFTKTQLSSRQTVSVLDDSGKTLAA